MTFEDFLTEKFGERYSGTKDYWETAQDNWFAQLDVQELIDYGQEYGNYRANNKS